MIWKIDPALAGMTVFFLFSFLPTLTLYISYESSVVCGVAPCLKMTLEVHLAFYGDSIVKASINSQAPNQRCLITFWNFLTDPEIGVQSYFLSYISFKIRVFTIIIFLKPRQHKDSKKVGFITMIWSINTQRLKAVKEFESKPKRWVESIWCQPSLGHYA